MSDTHTQAVPAVVLRRVYKAPRERVFAAWTTPEIAAKFLSPDDIKTSVSEMNVRPGGAFSITMLLPDGERLVARGAYREVRDPERLSMTWTWQEDNPADEHETLLTLEFYDLNGETELILTHERLASVESRDRHEDGWTKIAEKLAEVLS